VDGCREVVLIIRRRDQELGESGECHDADLGVWILPFDEGQRSGLGRLEAAGQDVGLAHAA
jgi:hypothetical protein